MARAMKYSGVDWIGEIPSDWKLVRTKNCYTTHKDVAGENADDYERLALTLNGVIKRPKDDATGLQPEAFNSYQILRENELVFKLIDLANISTSRVGYSPYVGIVSPAYIVLHPNQEDESKFGVYYFLSMWQREIFNNMGDDGVRSSLNASDLLNIPYVSIPVDEKKRIVAFLEAECARIDAVIEQTRASIEEYKMLKQSVITESVIYGIRPARPMKECSIDSISCIPESWEEIRNSFLFRENVRTPYEDSPSLSLSQADGLVLTDDMKERSLKTSTFDGWKRVEIGDLVLNRFKAHLGVFFAATVEGMVSFHYGVYEPIRRINSKYYEYLFHSDVYRGIFSYKSNGMTVGLQNLSNQSFYDVKSIYPPIEEQDEIVEYIDAKVSEIDSLIQKKEKLIAELAEYKKVMIFEYVTGKKDVPAC